MVTLQNYCIKNILMRRNQFINQKITEYVNHCILALDFYSKNDFEHALTDFRKSGEAFIKIYIVDKFGDTLGYKVIVGKSNIDNTPCSSKPHDLQYQELLDICKKEQLVTSRAFSRLLDIQKESNPTAHNQNKKHSDVDFRHSAELCKVQSFNLTKFIFDALGEPILEDLANAYNGNFNQALITSLKSSSWDAFYQYVDMFNEHCKYILISPEEYRNCTEAQLKLLSNVNWSFIVDFNPLSKNNGLYKAFMPDIETNSVPITINQRGQKNIVGRGTNGNINWLFANGLVGIPNSQTNDFISWRGKKYHKFIEELFSEFYTTSIDRLCMIFLSDDYDYIEAITNIISDIDIIPNDMIKYAFISDRVEFLDKVSKFNKYGINYDTFKISHSELITKLSLSVKEKKGRSDAIMVPARTRDSEQTFVDVSKIYSKLSDAGITIVHQTIADSVQALEQDTPLFYYGEQITWSELAIDVDVKRNKYIDVYDKVRGHLTASKSSLKFELQHKPGAGGTTIARRLAYDLRKEFPTIVLSKYSKIKTYNTLSVFIQEVNKPILAIVEASDINTNEIDELIRNCNTQKQIVIFVYVRRNLLRTKETQFSVYINDKMLDIDECNKFIGKVKQYLNKESNLVDLSNLYSNETEVIDFALAISEKNYSKTRIDEYIKQYINSLPEAQVQFIAYVSFIYHYSQKRVSELLFRSLFKKGLSEDLKQKSIEDRYIEKVLTQEKQEIAYSEYWRPRFSRFAESVLNIILGGSQSNDWKEQIPVYAKELIKTIKINNEYLVDETKDILKSVFLERRNEDLLGKEEEWQSKISNDQFSSLLQDVATQPLEQKNILLLLAESFPNEAHFWGHLARFTYEKSDNIEGFAEAMVYIENAFNANGDNDFNLYHIAGMCKRRLIEYYKRNDIKISVTELTEIAESANDYFTESRQLNSDNIHAYISQIQTIITVLEYGKIILGAADFRQFITDVQNYWFLEQYGILCDLIDETKILIEQQETLGVTRKINKSKYLLGLSEGKTNNVIGNFHTSAEIFKKLIDSSGREIRPKLRILYIRSILLEKVKGDYTKTKEAWKLLNTLEKDVIDKYITDNLLQDASNAHTLRLWFQFIRYTSNTVSIEEVVSRLKILYNNSTEHPLMRLEASYYLFIMNILLLIKSGTSINTKLLEETKELIKECKNLSSSDKYPFEWLKGIDNINGIINHKDRKNVGDENLLQVTGIITNINSRQQGTIILPCGLTAFFVPFHGGFILGQDETTEVKFNLAFRHDGLAAYNVIRASDIDNKVVKLSESEVEEVVEIEATQEEAIELEEEKPTIVGPKIVDKIDLTQFDKYKKK